MEFGIEKCAMLIRKSGKRKMTEEIELPNQKRSERSEKRKRTNTWEYWKRTPSNKCRRIRKNCKRVSQENEKTTRKKQYSRNLIKEMYTWAASLVRDSGPFLKWMREELQQIDQGTRKIMTMHKPLHSIYDDDRGRLITAARNNTDHTSINRTKISRKQNREE